MGFKGNDVESVQLSTLTCCDVAIVLVVTAKGSKQYTYDGLRVFDDRTTQRSLCFDGFESR